VSSHADPPRPLSAAGTNPWTTRPNGYPQLFGRLLWAIMRLTTAGYASPLWSVRCWWWEAPWTVRSTDSETHVVRVLGRDPGRRAREQAHVETPGRCAIGGPAQALEEGLSERLAWLQCGEPTPCEERGNPKRQLGVTAVRPTQPLHKRPVRLVRPLLTGEMRRSRLHRERCTWRSKDR
jgi:hypothetical protein